MHMCIFARRSTMTTHIKKRSGMQSSDAPFNIFIKKANFGITKLYENFPATYMWGIVEREKSNRCNGENKINRCAIFLKL